MCTATWTSNYLGIVNFNRLAGAIWAVAIGWTELVNFVAKKFCRLCLSIVIFTFSIQDIDMLLAEMAMAIIKAEVVSVK